MSRLQEAVRPYLLPLIQGEVSAFDVKAQTIIAAWITMFVMVAEQFDRKKVASTEAERAYLRTELKPPPNWKIWIGDYQRGAWVAHWVHFAVPIDDKHHPVEIMDHGVPRPNTQTTTLVVGRLYAHAVSSVTDLFDYVRLARPNLMKRIWPITRNFIVWPPKTLTDKDADGIAADFFLKSEEIARRERLALGDTSGLTEEQILGLLRPERNNG